nr:reverse transcriptase domain-containing protein [Tanacetum cinerariifolium]
MEKDKSIKNNEVVDKKIIEPSKLNILEPIELVDKKEEMEDRTNDESVRSVNKEPPRRGTKVEVKEKQEKNKIRTKPDKIKIRREAWKSPTMHMLSSLSPDSNPRKSGTISMLSESIIGPQCLAAGGNTFPEFRDNIQGYVLAAAINYNQGSGSLPSNTVANPKGELKAITTRSGLVIDRPTVPTPPKSITPEVDERVEETYTDPDLTEYTIKVPPPPKMLKALLSNKEKLQELANTPLNENCSAVILKNLPKKLGDHGKFRISCGFSELKCKALADLGASINLMQLSIWKELGLPKLIPTRMTLELANRAICTPIGIVRDVFVPVDKFTFPANFIIVDYESDPRVPLILGIPFLRTARALINVHGEEIILRNGDERLTLNMKDDTLSYSNQPQRESVNLINIFNVSIPLTLLTHFLRSSLMNLLLSHILRNMMIIDIESYLKEIEFLLYQDKDSSLKDLINQKGLANLDAIFVDPIPEMFTDEHTLDYSSPPKFDVYDDDFLEVESDAENVYDDPFDSKGEKIKEYKLLIDELDLPCDFLPPFEYDSFIS